VPQLYRDIVITDFLKRKGITLDQRESMAKAMHHSMNAQERVYDRRTASTKAAEGQKMVALMMQEDMSATSSEDSSSAEESDEEI
jgi:hypothetical protein